MLKVILPFVLFTLFSLTFLTLFLVVRVRRGACPLALIFKTLASVGFVFGGIYGAYISGLSLANMFVVFGLALALLGDVVLDLKIMHPDNNKIYLNSGIAVFSLSSIFYIVSTALLYNFLEHFWILFGGAALISVIVAVVILLLEKPLKLNFSGFKCQVFIYSCVVTMAAILTLSISFFINRMFVFSLGALLILLSDLILSMTYFGAPKKPNLLVVLNHVLYYLGELMIMSYIFFELI